MSKDECNIFQHYTMIRYYGACRNIQFGNVHVCAAAFKLCIYVYGAHFSIQPYSSITDNLEMFIQEHSAKYMTIHEHSNKYAVFFVASYHSQGV